MPESLGVTEVHIHFYNNDDTSGVHPRAPSFLNHVHCPERSDISRGVYNQEQFSSVCVTS